MQWGGAFTVFDAPLGMPLELRAFGAFEGTVSNEQALQPLLLDAVRAAVTQHPKGAVGALREKDAVAAAAQAHLAPRLHLVGAVGQLTIAMISMSEDDAAKVRTASVNAAARANMAAKMVEIAAAAASEAAAAATAAPSPVRCAKCSALMAGKFCRECGAPRDLAATLPPVKRPDGSSFVSVVKGPFPSRVPLVVEADEWCMGVLEHLDDARMSFESVPESSLEECTYLIFRRRDGLSIQVRGRVGRVLDAMNAPRDVELSLDGVLDLDSSLDCPHALLKGSGKLDDAATRAELQAVLVSLAAELVREHFASGAWSVAMLEGGGALAAAGPALAAAYLESSRRLPGTEVEVSSLTFAFPRAAGAGAGPAPGVEAMAAGTPVLVRWSDGQRYPGVVRESRSDQVLVAFPNGGLQWIPIMHVSRA
jgi:hypothetical protein